MKKLLIFAVLIGLSASSTFADIELIGREMFGPAYAVCTAGNYAYLCAGGTLVILNISDPSNPVEIGRLDTPRLAKGVDVIGGYAYVAGDEAGLRIIDVSDPTRPREVGSYDVPSWARDVDVAKNYAYVVNERGLYVIDVSDQTNPQEIGYLETPGWARQVYVDGTTAYVADMYEGLRIVDISDPTNPYEVGFYDIPAFVADVCVAGGMAYLAAADDLRILDVSDPTNPQETGLCPGGGERVWVADGYAYLGGGSLQVINISNPSNPQTEAYYDTPGVINGLHVADGYVYSANRELGLRVTDVSDPTNPQEVGYYDTPGTSEGIWADGNYVYLCDGMGGFGLRIIDIADPANPHQVGNCTTGFATDIQIVGEIAYVANTAVIGHPYSNILNSKEGLSVVDVSDPTNPQEMGFYHAPGAPQALYVAGDCVYLDGLRVIDISDPTKPQEVGFYDAPTMDIHVVGNYAYVAGYGDGFRIIDISDPTNPYEAGFCNTSDSVGGVRVAGNYAYITNGYGLRVIDISDPTNPYQVGAYDTIGYAYRVGVSGGCAYVASGWRGGVYAIDISDPTNPIPEDSYSDCEAIRLHVAGDYIYVCNSGGGLYILKYNRPADAPDIAIDPTSWDFGEIAVGNYSYKTFAVSNPGNATLIVSDTNLVGDSEFSFQSSGGGFNLSPGDTYPIVLRFVPSSAGSKAATLRLVNNVADKNPLDIPLQGMGKETVPVNNPPVAHDQPVSTDEDTPVAITLTASDPENDPLTYAVVSGPSNGLVVGTAPDVTYSPNRNFHGSDGLTFKVNDGVADSNIATVSITVNPVNDPPVITSTPVTTATEGLMYTYNVVADDVDEGDVLTYSLTTGPSGMTIGAGAEGLIEWTPAENQVGENNVVVQVTDMATVTDSQPFAITVASSHFSPQWELKPGWNLVSIPLQLPDNRLEIVLKNITGQYSSIWTYEASSGKWLRYVTNGPSFLNNLTTIDPNKGYWLCMNNYAVLTLEGEIADGPTQLEKGWNLVAYNSSTPQPVEQALSSIAGYYSAVWTYHAASGKWLRYVVDGPPFLNDLTILKPGQGYWLNAAVNCLWDVNN